MSTELKLALVQMCSTNDHAGNIVVARKHVAAAAARGMDLIAFPEVAGLMNRRRDTAVQQIVDEARDPWLAACRELARTHHIWIHSGSTPLRSATDTRFLNRSHLVRPDGSLAATYDKIHLFDVDLPDGKRIRESDRYAPGEGAVLADTPWGLWGMTVCYDLRFPGLYRDYARAGATVLFVPSAFAVNTGEAHWEPLLRARAIENGCFVVASAQSGRHDDGRDTYGHAMVVDPWGRVMVDMLNDVGVTDLVLDIGAVARTRQMIPSIANERAYAPAALPEHRHAAGED